MTKEEILTKLKDIISNHFDIEPEKITEDLSFQNDLHADSIDMVNMVIEIEETFGGEIDDEDADKIQTVGAAVDYIASR